MLHPGLLRSHCRWCQGRETTEHTDPAAIHGQAETHITNLVLFGNTISTSDVYRDNAATQNAAVIEFLSEHAGPIGIVMMDYAAVDRSGNYDVKGLALTQALIENNFRIPDGIQTTLSSSEERKPAYLYDLCGRHAQTNMHGKVIVMNGRKVMVK